MLIAESNLKEAHEKIKSFQSEIFKNKTNTPQYINYKNLLSFTTIYFIINQMHDNKLTNELMAC